MHRTTIMLPDGLKQRAAAFASAKGISIGALIRSALEKALQPTNSRGEGDTFFDDTNFFCGDIPEDLSSNPDAYLYDDFY